MQNINNTKSYIPYIVIILFVVLGAFGGWKFIENVSLLKETQTKLASTTEMAQIKTIELEGLLSQAQHDNSELSDALAAEKAKIGDFGQEIEDISKTVGTLEKLSKLDPELLKKYSKVFFLNEHYAPKNPEDIDEKYLYDKKKPEQIHTEVLPHLEDLLETSIEDNVNLKIASAYRSFGDQVNLKTNYKVIYGVGTANQFSADQGYSEHQLGTTVDFVSATGTPFVGFDVTAEYKWLTKNAYKYGFVLSYPKNNAYYQFEPWHWRFVGEDLARYLHKKDMFFYDMDQRDIDKYLVSIFD